MVLVGNQLSGQFDVPGCDSLVMLDLQVGGTAVPELGCLVLFAPNLNSTADHDTHCCLQGGVLVPSTGQCMVVLAAACVRQQHARPPKEASCP